MTSIVFVSDIHLNLRKNYDFELNRFMLLADELAKQKANLLVLGGDIFDKAYPNLDEIYAFYEFISKVKDSYQKILIISGNHEDLNKNETCFHKLPMLDYQYIEFTKDGAFQADGVMLYFVSHHKIKEILDIEVSKYTNLLFSHIRANIGVVKAEAPLSKISKHFDKVILGDIHIPYQPYKNIEYCGSPYTIQYEAPRETGYFYIELEKGNVNVEFKSLKHLPQKIRYDLSVKEYEELLPYLDKNNLYKIVLHDNVQSLADLKIPKNVSIVFNSTIDNEEIEEQLVEIKRVGCIDVIDTLIKLAEYSWGLDEESFKEGQKLINEFKKGLYD